MSSSRTVCRQPLNSVDTASCRPPKKASMRSRSADEVSPHHAGDAYDNLATTVTWKTVSRFSVSKRWCRRVRNASNDYAQIDTTRTPQRISCCLYGQRLNFIDSWDGWNRRRRDHTARRHISVTQKRSSSTWCDSGEGWASPVSDMFDLFFTRPTIRRWDKQIGVISKLYHRIARCEQISEPVAK